MSRSEETRPVYHISAVASMTAVHPQTLRMYERQGLLKPSRSRGNTRLYSMRDVERVKVILHLTRDEGVNLAGVAKILELQQRIVEVESAMRGWMQRWQERIQRELFASERGIRSPAGGGARSVKIAIRRRGN